MGGQYKDWHKGPSEDYREANRPALTSRDVPEVAIID